MIALFVLCLCLSSAKPVLRFSREGEFRIVQLTDLHFGEDRSKDDLAVSIMNTIMDLDKPDFVAFTGDMVSGGNWNHTEGWYRDQWKHWSSVVTERSIPYAYTLGNHDAEANLSRREVIAMDMENPMSLTSLSSEMTGGASNFVIPVYSSEDPSEVAMNLWFFDSEDYDCYGVKGYGCIPLSVIEWYRKTSAELRVRQKGVKKGLAFMHIPFQEYMYAFNHYPSMGRKDEDVCCQGLNTGLLAAMREEGNILGVFAGHDHCDDYVVDFEGILLGYGRKSGVGSYGPSKDMLRGGRVFVLREKDLKIKTYIRQEDGSVDEQKPSRKLTPMQEKCSM